MVFLIQSTQNRDAEAMQVKLDEIIRAIGHAKNELLDLEELEEEDLDAIKQSYQEMARKARGEEKGETIGCEGAKVRRGARCEGARCEGRAGAESRSGRVAFRPGPNPGVSPAATRSMSGCSALIRMHAAKCLGWISTSCGSTSRQAATACGQRVWNRHPDGGSIGDGTSPWSITRLRRASTTGSGTGTAEIRARVYGMSGES